MSLIRIKRSGASGSPAALAQGEMAYSFLGGTQSNGGDRLYIGTGTETGGIAANIEVIGGKYFTNMLDHVPGVLTPTSALIVDSSGKIDILNVDNITLDGNTISTTNLNGNLVLSPNGTGIIDAGGKRITNGAAPSGNTDFVTLGYLNTAFTSNLNLAGDTGSDTVSLLTDTLTVTGGTGLSSVVTNNTITLNLDNTTVSAASYGSATGVAAFTVDAQGRLTAASTTAIAIPSTQVTDFTEAAQDAVAAAFAGGTQSGLTVTYNDATNSLSLNVNDPTITLSGDVNGSATMTDLGNVTITTTIQPNSVVLGTDTTGNYVATVGVTAGTGLSVSGSGTENAAVTIAGVDATTSVKGVASYSSTNFNVTSGVVTTKAFTIGNTAINNGGTTTSLPGLTDITAGNLFINANEISASNTNGNISLKPNGTGTIAVNSKRITGLAEPIDPTDAVTKQYADGIATGLHVKEGVDAATTTTLAIHTGGSVTYNNGTAGVGATLTLGVALTTLDGHTLINGDRILIKNEANAIHNGIYVRTSSTVLTRDTLFDSDEEIEGGDFVFVVEGTVNAGTGWVQTATVNIIGTDAIVFQQFSGSGTYEAGAGLSLTSGVFDVNVDSSSIEISADTLRVKAAGITNAMLAGSISNDKLTNSTISGVALGSTLYGLTFNNGLVSGSYNGSTPVTISVDSATAATASKIVMRDSFANFSANTITAALAGNATTATTLQTARTINGVSFDGSANITVTSNTTNALTFNNSGTGATSGTTFNGGTAQTISYNTLGASPLAGSTSLTTLGTVTTGTWNAGVISSTYGGTGVNNGGRTLTINTGNLTIASQAAGSTISLGGNITTANSVTTSGNFALTLTTTAATSVTLPTTGTLATLAGTETFTNKTLTLPTIGGTGATFNGSTSGTTVLKASATAGTTTITMPATTGTVITSGDTGTVTNTMLAGSIAITKLAASTISGVSLGNNLNALTIGTGLSGSSYNGSSAVTIAANIATTTTLGIASFDSTNFTVSSGAVSVSAIDGGTY